MDDRLDALLACIDDAELRDALRREIARTRDPMPVWTGGGSALHASIAAALMQCAGIHSAHVHSEPDPFGAMRCVVRVRPDDRDERAQEIAELLVSVVPAGIVLVGGVERAVGDEGYAVARWDWED